MKIRVSGKSKLSKSETRYAASFFCHEIMSKRLCKNLILNIHFTKDLDCSGEIYPPDNWEEPLREFEININPNRIIDTQLSSLGHECYHVKQFATNELKYMLIGPYEFRYKKKFYNEKDLKYKNRPDEIEAFKWEPILFKRYKQHKRERDARSL